MPPADRTWKDWRPDRAVTIGILAGVALYLVVLGLGQFALALGIAGLIVLALSLVRTIGQLRESRARARRRVLNRESRPGGIHTDGPRSE